MRGKNTVERQTEVVRATAFETLLCHLSSVGWIYNWGFGLFGFFFFFSYLFISVQTHAAPNRSMPKFQQISNKQ